LSRRSVFHTVLMLTETASSCRIQAGFSGAGNSPAFTFGRSGSAANQAGWSRFDEAAPAYTDEQVRRERELYP
jgi:hypothetical protein